MKARSNRSSTIIKSLFDIVISIVLLCGIGAVVLNRYVVDVGSNRLMSEAEAQRLDNVDCILILGAGVYSNRYPSAMLEDRLLEGIRLYKLGVSDRLLMSGDNSKIHYNEVKVMKDYAVESGVPPSHVFQDHAGFSTYESLYRARDIFAAGKIIIVTQDYHMYRALYIARALGLDAYGVVSNPRAYAGQVLRDFRELLARPKDVFYCIFKPLPTFLGDVLPVNGDGSVTD